MAIVQQLLIRRACTGFPTPTDFRYYETDLSPLQDGEFLAKALYVSVDPYMRAYSNKADSRNAFFGLQVALYVLPLFYSGLLRKKIIESKTPDYPVGKYVVGQFGCRTYTNVNKQMGEMFPYYILPDLGDLPLSAALGVVGMPGATAYFGFLELCQPKAGETVVVTCAAGAVGSIVGQIAKIKGCRVIGITGTKEKCDLLLKEFNFDAAINYKTDNVAEALKKYAPNGIDCYFDNVGGDISVTILKQMNTYGRVSVCGCISEYKNTEPLKIESFFRSVVLNQLKLEGFSVARWRDRLPEAFDQIIKWIQEGKIKYREKITNGFENLLTVLTDTLEDVDIEKVIIKV